MSTREKVLEEIAFYIFVKIMKKYIFIYNQYGLYPLPYTIRYHVDGWMSEYQTIWRIWHEIAFTAICQSDPVKMTKTCIQVYESFVHAITSEQLFRFLSFS